MHAVLFWNVDAVLFWNVGAVRAATFVGYTKMTPGREDVFI